MFFSVDDYHGRAESNFSTLSGKFFGDGTYAVQIFMIISGFVIFFLLDKKRESYGQFILRRFFRLYPLYIGLLITAIIVAPFTELSIEYAKGYMSLHAIDYYNRDFHGDPSDRLGVECFPAHPDASGNFSERLAGSWFMLRFYHRCLEHPFGGDGSFI